MKKLDITPDKWDYDFNIVLGIDHVICKCSGYSLIQAEANAKAISAVPNMIDALISCYKQLENLNNPNGFKPTDITIEMQKAKKALIKAGVEL